MGRSVSHPYGAAVAYRYLEVEGEDDLEYDDDLAFEFEYHLDWVREEATSRWSSLEPCDEWLGREDHAILCNEHCYIGVSEYCGMVATWLVARDDNDHPGLSRHWCEQVEERFKDTFGELVKLGTFSNGESVYERRAS